jgi:RNA polymerase subunit RPABC4/transcription elongation factor Spt4
MKAGGGRGSVMPPNRGRAEPDPLAAAAPKDAQPIPASIEPIPAPEPDDPNACVNCGVVFDEEETVCVECGHRRPTVSNWDGTAIFRLVAGIIIACELLVLILQWTTTGKPFGLRQRTRHAVLIKVGLRKDLTPAEIAAAAAKSGANSTTAKLKDPDLLLKDHRLTTDKNNGAQYITGTVKNISQYRYLGVQVNFALLDDTGQVIPDANVSAYTQTIEPGKDWPFKVLVLDPDAKTYRPLPPVEGVR